MIHNLARDFRDAFAAMGRDFLAAATDFVADLRAFIQPRN